MALRAFLTSRGAFPPQVLIKSCGRRAALAASTGFGRTEGTWSGQLEEGGFKIVFNFFSHTLQFFAGATDGEFDGGHDAGAGYSRRMELERFTQDQFSKEDMAHMRWLLITPRRADALTQMQTLMLGAESEDLLLPEEQAAFGDDKATGEDEGLNQKTENAAKSSQRPLFNTDFSYEVLGAWSVFKARYRCGCGLSVFGAAA